MSDTENVTIEQLIQMLKIHKKELSIISKLSEAAFGNFKSNFMIGKLDPEISKGEAIFILKEMITTNLNMQKMIKKGAE